MNLPPAAPARIPRATYASMVGERLRDSILDGTLKPGSQLNEVELAANFGVSRGPVREALQRLIQEGLLRSEPHRGVFVPVIGEADVLDIYLAREALESAAVQHIIATGKAGTTYKRLDRLVRAMEIAEEEGDWDAVASSDLEFHAELVSAAESPRLSRMFSTVITETRLCLSVLTGAEERRQDLVAEHRTICERIHGEDPPGALSALKKHFDDAVVTLHGGPAGGTGSGSGR